MNSPTPATSLHEVLNLVVRRRKLWMATTAICGAVAMVVAILTPRTWQATQALVVRQEAAASRTAQPGKFSDLYEMRTLQETILEIARSRQVIAATLQAVSTKESGAPPIVPSEAAIERFRKRLDMLPPGGAEFGKTEVFYFGVKANSRPRAVALVDELCNQLEIRMRTLISERAGGLAAEVKKQVEAAEAILAEQTDRLREFEMQIGPDLGELRMLHSALSGQSEVRQLVISLEDEARRYQTQASDAQRLWELLQTAQNNPEEIVAMPNSLLATQPALQQLKSGLVRVQLTTARIRGTRSDEHPRVVASLESEASIRRDLHRELASALESAQAEKKLAQQRYEATQVRLNEVAARLNRLAESRVEYSNRVAAVDNSREAVDAARQQLSAARAAQAASASASLVTRIDRPEVGTHPLGPGRTTVTAAGLFGGFLLGIAICFWQLAPTTGSEEPNILAGTGHAATAALAARAGLAMSSGAASGAAAPSTSEWWHDVPPDASADGVEATSVVETAKILEKSESSEMDSSVNAAPAPLTTPSDSHRLTVSTADRATLQLSEIEIKQKGSESRRRSSLIADVDAFEIATSDAETNKAPRLPSKSSVGDFAGLSLQQALQGDAEPVG